VAKGLSRQQPSARDSYRPKGDGRDYQGLAGRVLTELEVDVKSSPQKTARIARELRCSA
jgi:hypothetical protein